jgi:hypothetical protein
LFPSVVPDVLARRSARQRPAAAMLQAVQAMLQNKTATAR